VNDTTKSIRPPKVVIPWEEKRKELPELPGDEALVKRVWEQTDSLGYLYVYFCLLAF